MRNRLIITAAVAAVAVAGVTVTAAADPFAEAAGSRLGGFDPAKLEAALDKFPEAGAPSVVAEVRDGDDYWAQARGPRAIDGDTATEPTDQVRIGSVTKSMIATVLLQLSDAGELDLDAEIRDLLPGVLPYEEPITIRQLMSHTSGVPDYFVDVYPSLLEGKADSLRTNRLLEFTPEEMITTATGRPLDFAPGTDWRYSNTGYFVLGLLLEDLTDDSVESLLEERIIEPVGLDDTYVPTDETTIMGPHPNAYYLTGEAEDPMIDTSEQSATHMWAAGAVVSTMADTNAFYRAMYDGTLLAEEELAEAMTMNEHNEAYGLGLQAVEATCEPIDGGIAFGHTGATFGHSTLSFHSPDGNRQISLTVNLEDQLAPNEKLWTAINDFAAEGLCSQPGSAMDTKDMPSLELPKPHQFG